MLSIVTSSKFFKPTHYIKLSLVKRGKGPNDGYCHLFSQKKLKKYYHFNFIDIVNQKNLKKNVKVTRFKSGSGIEAQV